MIADRAFELLTRRGGGGLIYAQTWEDFGVDSQLLSGGDAPVLGITSGGGFALSACLHTRGRVLSVDINPNQTALAEGKIAAAQALDQPAFWRLLTEATELNLSAFARVRPLLSPPTAAWFDSRPGLVRGGLLNAGLAYQGLRLVRACVRALLGPQLLARVLAVKGLDDQRALYDGQVQARLWSPFLDRTPIEGMVVFGVCPNQLRRLRQAGVRTVADLYKTSLRALFISQPLDQLWHWRYILTGQYAPAHAPDHLRPERFAELKEASRRITLLTGDLTTTLRSQGDVPFDLVNLSDVHEWMAPDAQRALFDAVGAARWRTLLLRSASGLGPPTLAHGTYLQARSEALSSRERTGAYRRVFVFSGLSAAQAP